MMSSITRPLAGKALVVSTDDPPPPIDSVGRSARTLIHDGQLRVTLGSLAPGSGLPEHHSEGPITLQALSGSIDVTATDETHTITPGQLLALEGGVLHSLKSNDGAAYLLTVVHPVKPKEAREGDSE